ncbi:MAG: helix-turn-helix transcriptional regulator [Ruminococcaceae bacterium]|nr:helix-turn-helix transcriptional regulator [Oscillospiraceae bacterium]
MEKNKEKLSKFATTLSRLRKERGISQKKAATELGISQALLSHYEKGIRECGLDFVIRCSEYYGVTTDYLLGVSENRNGMDNNYFSELTSDKTYSVSMLSKATKYLLDMVSASSSDIEEKSFVYDYYLLTLYRGALTLAKAGMLPKELFKIDYSVAKDLASAAIAIQDAKFVLIEDRSRTGVDSSQRTVINELIEEAEALIMEDLHTYIPE